MRERVLERAGRVQVCRKGHHSPATWGRREELLFLLGPPEKGWLWLSRRANEVAWYGTERTLLGARIVQRESSPSQLFPQHLILQMLSVVITGQSQHR